MNRKCIIGQSGGPTVTINASLAGAISKAYESGFEHVLGMINGISGFLDEKIIDLCEFKSAENLKKLINTPAMYLGSCRYRIPTDDNTILDKIFNILYKHEITDFFYIGGNDSMDTIKKLKTHGKAMGSNINFIGIPKTIDNDLLSTHYTPGYPSACRYVATTIMELSFDCDIYPLKSVTIVEIMGRDAGWLAASAQLVNACYPGTVDFIYLPEVPFDEDKFMEDLKEKLKIKDTVIIAVSEGIRDASGNMIATDDTAATDDFGHKSNGGCALYLKQQINRKLNHKVRAIQLNTMQRCSTHLSSDVDLENAFSLGSFAVSCSTNNLNGVMVSIRNEADGFQLTASPIDHIANGVKNFPTEWINSDGKGISDAYVDYITPLISKDGLEVFPKFLKRN